MKKVITALALLVSMNLLAAPVPQNEIDRLNAVLAFMPSEYVSIKVISAEKDEATQKLTAISAEGTFLVKEESEVTLSLGLRKISNDQVYVSGDITGSISKKPLTKTQVLALLTMATPYITQLNDSENYDAILFHDTTNAGTNIDLLIESVKSESFDEIKMSAFIPQDSTIITGGFAGTLYFKESLAKLITNIIK